MARFSDWPTTGEPGAAMIAKTRGVVGQLSGVGSNGAHCLMVRALERLFPNSRRLRAAGVQAADWRAISVGRVPPRGVFAGVLKELLETTRILVAADMKLPGTVSIPVSNLPMFQRSGTRLERVPTGRW